MKKRKTAVEPVPLFQDGSNEADWFLWTGEKTKHRIVQVTPKRNEYDLFQNTYCPAISESKIGGNSNARVITPGPVGAYTLKYPVKNTQESDAKPYESVVDSLTAAYGSARKHESDRAESLRLLIRAGFAHNKTNVVGSSMAAFLTRHNSRFFFSHDSVFVPLDDLWRVVTQGRLDCASVNNTRGYRYLDVMALNYLCRPSDLEDCDALTFYTEYEAVTYTAKNRTDDHMDFQNTEYFQHPSHIKGTDGKIKRLKILRPRHVRHLPQVRQNAFPDAAVFDGNILTADQITDEMELYACYVLLLCSTYRCENDLKQDGSYVLRLRRIHQEGHIQKHEKFLQNLQDSRANFDRVKVVQDELQRITDPFSPHSNAETWHQSDAEDDNAPPILQGQDLDALLDSLEEGGEFSPGKDCFDALYMPAELKLLSHSEGRNTQLWDRHVVQHPMSSNNQSFCAAQQSYLTAQSSIFAW